MAASESAAKREDGHSSDCAPNDLSNRCIGPQPYGGKERGRHHRISSLPCTIEDMPSNTVGQHSHSSQESYDTETRCLARKSDSAKEEMNDNVYVSYEKEEQSCSGTGTEVHSFSDFDDCDSYSTIASFDLHPEARRETSTASISSKEETCSAPSTFPIAEVFLSACDDSLSSIESLRGEMGAGTDLCSQLKLCTVQHFGAKQEAQSENILGVVFEKSVEHIVVKPKLSSMGALPANINKSRAA